MPQNWKTYNLGEVANIKYGKDHKKLEEGTYPCYGTGGIMRFVDKYLSKEESVLIPRKGSLNNIYYINKPFWTVDTLFWTQVNAELIFPKYLYYNFKTVDFASKDVGSAVPSLTTSLLNGIELKIPPLQEQRTIASILSALDDKIELNLQMNKTLEDMAMALYKHWFVDFGPFQNGEFVDSELGMIPKGWEVKCLEELLLVKPMNGLYKKKEFQGFGSRWLKMKSVYGLDIITNQEMELISVTSKEIDKFGCLYDDLVFGRTSLVLEGIGKCAIIKSKDDTPIFESNLFRIRPDKNKIDSNILFLFFKSEKGREEVRKLARQTAAVSITSKDLIGIKIPCPTMEVQESTSKALDNYILKIISNLKENQTLTTLRDTLLPKLISGEVRVKDAKKTLTAAL